MFTKKDFLLLEDAINEGIADFLRAPNTIRIVGLDGLDTLERVLRFNLSDAMSEKLKYTSDGFDSTKFKRSIVDHEHESKKIRKEIQQEQAEVTKLQQV